MENHRKENDMNLIDNMRIKGSDLPSFRRVIEDISENTYVFNAQGDECSVLSYCKNPPGNAEAGMLILDRETLWNTAAKSAPFKVAAIGKKVAESALFSELIESTQMMLAVDKNDTAQRRDNGYYYVSRLTRPTLFQRAKVTYAEREHCLYQNMHLADELVNTVGSEEISFLTRKNGKDRKIFAAFGGYACYIPQNILFERVIDCLPRIKSVNWEITHDLTVFHAKLSGIKDIPTGLNPGIRVITSDIGASGIRISLTLGVRKSYVIISDVNIEHRGNDVEAILQKVEEQLQNISEIFSRYALLLEKGQNNSFLPSCKKVFSIQKISEKKKKRLYDALSECDASDIKDTFANVVGILDKVNEDENIPLSLRQFDQIRTDIGNILKEAV